MTRRPLLAVLSLLAAPVHASDRTMGVSSFERVRITGPYQVRIVTGSPSVRVSGDRDAADRVEVRVDGTTLTIRRGASTWGERPDKALTEPVTVTLATPRLSGVAVFAGAAVDAAAAKGDRVDLSISGAGSIKLANVAADQLALTVIGAGDATLGGRVRMARLTTNGSGKVDASALQVDDLTVRIEGPGETRANARSFARISNSGLGRVLVTGKPTCTVANAAGGPVVCGAP